ncbi:MAG: sugar ABC transporter substrate-binding protein [Christensenellaceae bacterium]
MKKVVVLLIVVGLFVGMFSGCSMSSPVAETKATDAAQSEAEASAVQEKEIVIGYTPLSMELEYFQTTAKAMEEKAAEIGGVKVIIKDPQMDPGKQATGIEEMLTAGADYIAICSIDLAASNNSIKTVHDKGKQVISHVSALEGADIYIGLDEYTFGFMEGEAAGKYIKENLDGKGVVAILDADSLGGDLLLRSKGIEEGILSQAPDSKIQKTTAFEEAAALSATETLLLENPEINFICTTNDPGSLGALAAVESKGLQGKVVISSVGSDKRLVEAIADGKILFSVDSGAAPAGVAMVEAAVALAKGEKVEKNISLETPMIDKVEAQKRLAK